MTKSHYEGTCTFEDAAGVTLFNKENYKVSISVVITANEMRTVSCVFDTGAGLNVIREDFLGKRWARSMKQNISNNLKSATNQGVRVAGTITSHVRMCDCRVCVVFGVVKSLAVPVLLGNFIHRSLCESDFSIKAEDLYVQF